ncbi:DUF2267 domain-containing protein [Micromonospora echinofusca]|uniref:Putative pterin-4-alpha-carbinolamine dehydratase n=1 Tax=Micromonospora echinofusca TaxID=47858 RepID=A0ABS3VW81_MICEH|nr:DUF2267 domain-containing protein [Micromonospora echinofusca]MBO4208806.1 DUF2267 domain-containing protein [Micromonospora echinofusca]
MRKQMEGDNKRRRALARQARERGRRPSETGATLGASKQLEHLDRTKRDGPPAAGQHKPQSSRGGPAPPPAAPAERTWPRPHPDLAAGPQVTTVGYQDLVGDVGRRAGLDFDQARAAAEATVLALARALDEADQARLLDAVPTELHDDVPLATISRRPDLPGFLSEVARISGRTPEQARYQAEATLAALAEQDPDLVDELEIPADLRGLLGTTEPGGGLVAPTGRTAGLTDGEIREELAELPYWSGDTRALSRTIELPPANLDRVLDQVAQLRQRTGRGPTVSRPTGSTAVLTVRSRTADTVTRADIELAHRLDDLVEEAAGGIAG